MSSRQVSLGIKQTLRLEWLEKAAFLQLSGMDPDSIRQELHQFLSHKTGSGDFKERGETSRSQAVNILKKVWITPESELKSLRDRALAFLQENPEDARAIHWCMVSAAYPFWFQVATQTGRLLTLQSLVTQKQVLNRLKEQFGDREAVGRTTRHVLRSFVAWGVLKDTKVKGCYERTKPIQVGHPLLAVFLLESALCAIPSGRIVLEQLKALPALFPFNLPYLSGESVGQRTNPIQVVRYGLEESCVLSKS